MSRAGHRRVRTYSSTRIKDHGHVRGWCSLTFGALIMTHARWDCGSGVRVGACRNCQRYSLTSYCIYNALEFVITPNNSEDKKELLIIISFNPMSCNECFRIWFANIVPGTSSYFACYMHLLGSHCPSLLLWVMTVMGSTTCILIHTHTHTLVHLLIARQDKG